RELLRSATSLASGDAKRIVLIIDHFERLLRRNDNRERTSGTVLDVLEMERYHPLPGLQIVVVIREDYLPLISGEAPELSAGNWMNVPPFHVADAQAYLESSGLQLN